MPPDRLLEARKTYDALAEASQSLTASSVKITNSLDSAELLASALTDRLARNSILARTFSEALHRPLWTLFAFTMIGAFLGALLAAAARVIVLWAQNAVLSWWGG